MESTTPIVGDISGKRIGRSPKAENNLVFYVPDLAPQIRAHVGEDHGALVKWFRRVATAALKAEGALLTGDEADVLKKFREVLARRGAREVSAKLDELATSVVDAAAERVA